MRVPCEQCYYEEVNTATRWVAGLIWIAFPIGLIGSTLWSVAHGNCDMPPYASCQEYLVSSLGWAAFGSAVMTALGGMFYMVAALPDVEDVGRTCKRHSQ